MKLLQRQILATLGYHNLFAYPLNKLEIWRFLIKIPNSKLYSTSKSKIEKSIDELTKKKKIFKSNDYYFLPGQKQIVSIREKRKTYSRKKTRLVYKICQILKFLPWIRMVAITGALAMDNAQKEDDIDFLIITQKNRLWLTRFIFVVILEILYKRRRPNDKAIKDKICLNMFLDETALVLAKEKRNLFTAHEIVQMKPVLNKENTYQRFRLANKWVKQYLPNGMKEKRAKSKEKRAKFKDKRSRLRQGFGGQAKFKIQKAKSKKMDSKWEKLAYQFQLKYMKKRKTREDVSPHYAFFHPQDRGREILVKYKYE